MIEHKISVVIPCYNSEKMIKIVVESILDMLNSRGEYDYEIILVNDGSRDNTWDVLNQLSRENKKIIAINFTKNFGQHSAIIAGYRQVTGDIILGIDDDGEYDPKDMFKLIDKLLDGYDCVFARYNTNKSVFRSFGTKMNNMMATWLIDKPKEIDISSYCVMKRYVIDEIVRYERPFPYIAGLILRATKNIACVDLIRKKRIDGKSGYTLKKLVKLWINGFTAFSIKPLQVATTMGIGVAVCSFISAIVLIIERLFFVVYISGWASTIVCVSFFSGVIMIMLGIIGEYIGRIYISINNAPQYVIKEIIKQKGEDIEKTD